MIVKWSRALSDESRTVGLVAKDENPLPVVEKNFVMKSRNSPPGCPKTVMGCLHGQMQKAQRASEGL